MPWAPITSQTNDCTTNFKELNDKNRQRATEELAKTTLLCRLVQQESYHKI